MDEHRCRTDEIELEGDTSWELGVERQASFKFFCICATQVRFAIEWERSRYSAVLRRNSGDSFSGKFAGSGDGGNRAVEANCCLTKKGDEYKLAGFWNESVVGGAYKGYLWTGRLSEV